jgi:hypothetical protein
LKLIIFQEGMNCRAAKSQTTKQPRSSQKSSLRGCDDTRNLCVLSRANAPPHQGTVVRRELFLNEPAMNISIIWGSFLLSLDEDAC